MAFKEKLTAEFSTVIQKVPEGTRTWHLLNREPPKTGTCPIEGPATVTNKMASITTSHKSWPELYWSLVGFKLQP